MNFNKFTIKGQEAIQGAQQYASDLGHQSIENGHLLHGLIQADENVLPFIFNKLSVNESILTQALDSIITSYPKLREAISIYPDMQEMH